MCLLYMLDGPGEQPNRKLQLFWSALVCWCSYRWGYRTLGLLKESVAGYRAAGIPLETVWSDIDYMDRWDPLWHGRGQLRVRVSDP